MAKRAGFYLLPRGKYTDAPRPDLILSDLNLLKKDGGEILDEVKADPKLRAIPIVVLTTSELDEDMMGCIAITRMPLSPNRLSSMTLLR